MIKKRDIILALVMILLGIVCYGIIRLGQKKGSQVVIYVDQKEIGRYELNTYTTKDNHTWTADDAKVAGTTAWDTVWNVSNGTKFDCTVVVDANVADALNPFWAYDQRSATESGTFTSEELSALAFNDQGYTILAKAGKNYVIFITDSASYINGSISPMIYAYDSNGLIAGVKTVK